MVGGQCLKNPVPIGVGYLAQYIVKPLLGFLIAKVGHDMSPVSCHKLKLCSISAIVCWC